MPTARGLPTSGNKAALVERLVNYQPPTETATDAQIALVAKLEKETSTTCPPSVFRSKSAASKLINSVIEAKKKSKEKHS